MSLPARGAARGAAGCAVLLAATWIGAFHIGFLQRADRSIFVGFYNLTFLYYRHRINATITFFVSACDARPYIYLVLVAVAVALVQRQLRVALCVAALVGAANLTTQLLKPTLPEERSYSLLGGASPVAHASWPSGHATAAMALVLAFTLAAPARLRPLVAGLGAVFAAAVGCSLMARGSHYPSDVLAGFLVAATYALLAVAVLASERSGIAPTRAGMRRSARDALGPVGVAVIGAVALGIYVLISHVHEAVNYAGAHAAFILGALAIAAVSIALSTAVVVTVRIVDADRAPAAASKRS